MIYKEVLEKDKSKIINVYWIINELYNKYITKRENIDLFNLKYSNTIKLEKLKYIELYSGKNNIQIENFVYRLNVSHEGGHRQENELVKYNKSNIVSRNKYGYEVAVNSNGNVIDAGINVELPEDGYILSGHGTNRQLISEQIMELFIENQAFIKKIYSSSLNLSQNSTKTLSEYILKLPNLYKLNNLLILFVQLIIVYLFHDLIKYNHFQVILH